MKNKNELVGFANDKTIIYIIAKLSKLSKFDDFQGLCKENYFNFKVPFFHRFINFNAKEDDLYDYWSIRLEFQKNILLASIRPSQNIEFKIKCYYSFNNIKNSKTISVSNYLQQDLLLFLIIEEEFPNISGSPQLDCIYSFNHLISVEEDTLINDFLKYLALYGNNFQDFKLYFKIRQKCQ